MNQATAPNSDKRDLVVIIHGMGGMPQKMRHVVDVVRATWKKRGKPDPMICCPAMGYSMASFEDPCEIAIRLLKKIDVICESEPEFDNIILVGYSFGSLVARKAYVYACGQCADTEFDPHARNLQPREWVKKVERIVLLAGMNRGWHMSAHVSILKLIQWGVGVALGNAFMAVTLGRKIPLIFRVHRGAPFLTLLRLQWIATLWSWAAEEGQR